MNRFLTSLLSAAGVLACTAAPAMADTLSTGCQLPASAPVFAPWLDPADYVMAKGANFESGASGWSWGGQANIVPGDDGHLPAAPGSHVVQIPGGGVAKSPKVCVDITTPTIRFLVRRVSGTGNLTVKGQISGASGISLTTFLTFSGSGSWQPSPVILFPAVFTSVLSSTGLNAQFQFVSDPGTTYRIDDVYLDPYKKW